MFDLQEHPGLLYVAATLLPLASAAILLIVFAIRSFVRQYAGAGGLGDSVHKLLGSGRPIRWPAYLATAAIAAAFLLSLAGAVIFISENHHGSHGGHGHSHAAADHWADSMDWAVVLPKSTDEEGQLPDQRHGTVLSLGYRIDNLAVVMFLMVTFVATLIHLFSIGYMRDELSEVVENHEVHTPGGHLHRRGRFGRFFLFLSLFCFSMLNLILADNLFQVFLSWELVGVCSYLLIGFYYERTSASNAANKAFITNRIGDAGFIIGMLILWTYVGTFNFEGIFTRLRAPAADAHSKLELAGQIVRAEPAERSLNELQEDMEKDRVMLRVSTAVEPVTLSTQAVLLPRHSDHLHGPEPGGNLAAHAKPNREQYSFMPYWLFVVAGLGIFLGCVGKSAQFPLHVWLPDAMEGPTPVSALIHAATMVAAGVYLVGRCFPLFAPEALLTIAYVGAITLFVAATIAVVMTDIKKVLAYSTVSQLGYMMLALGVGGWAAGLFHLITHAFFKALLFLGSGSVIYGCHHVQEMGRMGGLYPKMKITALTMLMGVLAICGIPLFSGWYSKDAVLAHALGFAMLHQHHFLLFLLPLLTAGLTTFYMFRMWFMTFTGKPRDEHVYEHAHESPWVMTVPLILLAFFSVTVAWGWPLLDAEASELEHFIHHSQPASVMADLARETVESLANHWMAGLLALGMVVVGLTFASLIYYYNRLNPADAVEQFPLAHRFLYHKWYFDEIYSALLVRPALAAANWCRAFDANVIDGFVNWLGRSAVKVADFYGAVDRWVVDGLVNLIASVSYGIGIWFRRAQTGYLRSYVLFLVLAAVGIWVVLYNLFEIRP